ncbi:5-formyltetrahydrofolate cyclo-ligase [Leptothoe kymatousa]|uniref:5-formyltetrahydrofolate cyclo-ligase n=1 Tax=Leptothoe kymatousa TAU-MAC 1615 TaxID=2364775 RepID=A0ABS5Y3G2_9CYAN|nr:5-formyltetrahydrofolate cyclo-ligase [Leptothoe kymatousa]MBT9312362.1 5-formyltetrahydrofolate cyclo-ligase [Leptothoe kymatousa TAU-MAC 1615]
MVSVSWCGRHDGKDALRAQIWRTLTAHNATHRDPVGHIPNFVGAERAAERLAQTDLWQQAQVVKCNPDSPHAAVRLQALAAGKTLYMAVPRLARLQCFVELVAAELHGVSLGEAATMEGAMSHGKLVAFEAMQPIDVVVVGCVAVAMNGGRTGKGAGFADLELAMLRERGLVSATTPIVTTVHDLQVVAAADLPMQPHDWGLDLVVTPSRCLVTENHHPRPGGLDWSMIQPEQLETIPVLQMWSQLRH